MLEQQHYNVKKHNRSLLKHFILLYRSVQDLWVVIWERTPLSEPHETRAQAWWDALHVSGNFVYTCFMSFLSAATVLSWTYLCKSLTLFAPQVCEYRSSFYQDVISHFTEQHKDTCILMCPYCLKVFRSCGGFQLHYIRHQVKNVLSNEVSKLREVLMIDNNT